MSILVHPRVTVGGFSHFLPVTEGLPNKPSQEFHTSCKGKETAQLSKGSKAFPGYRVHLWNSNLCSDWGWVCRKPFQEQNEDGKSTKQRQTWGAGEKCSLYKPTELVKYQVFKDAGSQTWVVILFFLSTLTPPPAKSYNCLELSTLCFPAFALVCIKRKLRRFNICLSPREGAQFSVSLKHRKKPKNNHFKIFVQIKNGKNHISSRIQVPRPQQITTENNLVLWLSEVFFPTRPLFESSQGK